MISPNVEQNLVGATIAGKFLVEAYLGGGAMGNVYKAQQTTLKTTVAIKVMHPSLTVQPAFAARFLREAQAASRVDHPNSIRVLDYGEENGRLYIAMEYVAGRDLYTVVREDGRLPRARVVDILMQICAALSVAHEMGVIHRDLKPENIMVLPGLDDEDRPTDVVKVCDFGIAKLVDEHADLRPPTSARSLDEQAKLTMEGLVVGTPEYISPEQAAGMQQDARSDIYSLGVVLFELLTGRVPFSGDSPVAVMMQHVSTAPPRPRDLVPDVDPRLEAICTKAMQKEPADRYQSAREMRTELRALHRRSTLPRPILQVPIETSLPIVSALKALEPPPHAKSSRVAGVLVLFAVLALGALGGVRWWQEHERAPVVTQAMPQASAAASASASVPPRLEPLDAGALAAEPVDGDRLAAVTRLDSAIITRDAGVRVGARDAGRLPSAPSPVIEAAPTPDAGSPSAAAAAAAPATTATATPTSTTFPPAAPTFAPPPEPVYSPATARVTIEGTRASGTDGASVTRALDMAQVSRCYATSLLGVTARPPPARRTLHLTTDDGGKIDSVTVGGWPPMPQADTCILQVLKGRVIDAPSFSPVSADVDLAFLPD